MRGKHAFWSMLVLALILAVGGYSVSSGARHTSVTGVPESAVIPATDPTPGFLSGQGCESQSQAPAGGLLDTGSGNTQELACTPCDPSIPRCYRDRDCDAWCGGKRFGRCVWYNSCCKQCSCVA